MDSKTTFSSLHGIRDNALLLSLGNKYLCKDPYLHKIGLSVDSHLNQLKEDIRSLKRKFPGKFLEDQEVNTDGIVEDLYRISKWLKDPDKKIRKKCSVGELGRELEEGVDTMALAIDEIWDQVEGRGVSYSTRESAANFFGAIKNAINSVVISFVKTVILVTKIIFLVAALSALGFFALYMTMEKEEKYLKQITKIDTLIMPQNEIVARCNQEINELLRRVDSIRDGTETRQTMMEVMELNVKIQDLREKRQEAEVMINLYQNDRIEKEEKLEKIKNKTFMDRLLRRK